MNKKYKTIVHRIINRITSIEVYELIQVMVLALAIGFIVIDVFKISTSVFSKLPILLLVILGVTLCKVIDVYKNKWITYVLIIGSIVVFICCIFIFKWNIIDVVKGIGSLVQEGIDLTVPLIKRYIKVYSIITTLIIVGISYVIMKNKYSKIVIILCLGVMSFILNVLNYNFDKITVGCIIFLVILGVTNILNYFCNRDNGRMDISISLTPIFLLMTLVVLYLPTKETPLDWTKVTQVIGNIEQVAKRAYLDVSYFLGFREEEYSVSFDTSDEDDSLGGTLQQSDDICLRVIGNRTEDNLYIVGNYFNEYTGKNWLKDDSKLEYSNEEYRLDSLQLMKAFENQGYSEDEINDFAKYKTITLEYVNIRTTTLFTVGNLYEIEGDTVFNSDTTNVLFDKSRGNGDNYKLRFLEVDYSNPLVTETIKENKQNYSSYDEEMKDIIEARDAYIEANYSYLPDTVPDRVYDLTQDITEEYSNDYDKLRAIEEYLRTYPYTKTPKDIENKDFVDGFLFEAQEGYCTYYASAMAVMARCIHIPTRYVEGYVVDYSDSDGIENYNVTGRKAHAWTEAYIEGIGWVPFEPTSGYEDSRYKPWTISSFDYEEFQAQLEKDRQVTDYKPEDYKKETEEYQKHFFWKEWALGVGIMVTLTSLLFFIRLIIRFRESDKYKRSNYRDKVMIEFKKILYYSNISGYKIRPDQGPMEFCEDINRRLDFEDSELKQCIEIFMKSRYSDNEIYLEEVKYMENYENKLYEFIRLEKKFFQKIFIIKPIKNRR